MDRQPRRRSRKALMWGGLLVVAGVVAGIALVVMAFVKLDDKVSGFDRLDVPDVSQVFFGDTGDYVVYDESIGIPVDGAVPFSVSVRRTGSGLAVPVEASVDDITYDVSGQSGTAVFEFSIPAVGTYEIETSADVEAGLAQLAVGRSVLGDLLRGLVTAAVVGGGLILVGVLVALVGSIQRSPRRRGTGTTERPVGTDRRSAGTDSRSAGTDKRSAGTTERAVKSHSSHGRSPLSRRAEEMPELGRSAPPPPPSPVAPEVLPESPPPPPPPEPEPPTPEQEPAPVIRPAPVLTTAVAGLDLQGLDSEGFQPAHEFATLESSILDESRLQVSDLSVSGLSVSGLSVSGLDTAGVELAAPIVSSLPEATARSRTHYSRPALSSLGAVEGEIAAIESTGLAAPYLGVAGADFDEAAADSLRP
jgi:hypothetical protein